MQNLLEEDSENQWQLLIKQTETFILLTEEFAAALSSKWEDTNASLFCARSSCWGRHKPARDRLFWRWLCENILVLSRRGDDTVVSEVSCYCSFKTKSIRYRCCSLTLSEYIIMCVTVPFHVFVVLRIGFKLPGFFIFFTSVGTTSASRRTSPVKP